MHVFVFNRFPTRLVGAYGGLHEHRSATPEIDRIAAEGTVFDHVYVTSAECDVAKTWEPLSGIHASIRFLPGVAAPLLETQSAQESDASRSKIDQWLSAESWSKLVQFWRDDGFEISDTLTPQSVFDVDHDLFEELFDEEILFACDDAVEFLNAVERAAAFASDRELQQVLETEDVGDFLITSQRGGAPAGMISEPLLDSWRHVPLIFCSQCTTPGRFANIVALESVIDVICGQQAEGQETGSAIGAVTACASDHAIFSVGDDVAVRTADGLLTREVRDDTIRERFFAKPDDRWNQLDLASQLFDRLDRYRAYLPAVSDAPGPL